MISFVIFQDTNLNYVIEHQICRVYSTLSSPRRLNTFSNGDNGQQCDFYHIDYINALYMSDDWYGPAWYRFTGKEVKKPL